MADTDPKRISPWIPAIVETMVGARLRRESAIPHKNRLAGIVRDSALETACRAFLKYKAKIKLTEAHRNRETLVKTVKSIAKDIDAVVWETLDFNYNEVRCDLYHESAAKTITDDAFLDYQEAIDFVIDRLLDIRSDQMVKSWALSMAKVHAGLESVGQRKDVPNLHDLTARNDKVLVAVASLSPASVNEVNEFFRKAGDSLRLLPDEFTTILARNSGTKKFYYHNKDLKVWELSGLGEFRLGQIGKENEQ